MAEKRKIVKDFYSIEYDDILSKEGTVTFRYPTMTEFTKHDYDWYIIVALEKADKVTTDRQLLTRDLLLSYRWAIREGYQKQLEPGLNSEYSYPRNQNTIRGIQGFIDRIKSKST